MNRRKFTGAPLLKGGSKLAVVLEVVGRIEVADVDSIELDVDAVATDSVVDERDVAELRGGIIAPVVVLVDMITSEVVAVTAVGSTSDVVSLTTVGSTVPISVLCGGTSEVSDVLVVGWMTSVDESVTDAIVGMFVPVLCGGISEPVLEALVGGSAVAEDSGGVIAKMLVTSSDPVILTLNSSDSD